MFITIFLYFTLSQVLCPLTYRIYFLNIFRDRTSLESILKEKFAHLLLDWYSGTNRNLPWKGIKDPYLIWLSEIILQQTRVEQGLPYYLKFKEAFPNVVALANADEDSILKLWEGLGYYSRARNLHAAAQYIAFELGGVFPDNYQGILALKGVGPYTAAAIASFAFKLPHAVVDGNVYRVLARLFGIKTPIDSTAGKKYFHNLAQELLDKTAPDVYNQAIMDFGATHCTPALPNCNNCVFQENCVAALDKKVSLFPVKEKRIKKVNRYFHYFVLEKEKEVIIQKRTGKDIWRNLYEFPLVETKSLDAKWEDFYEIPLWKTVFENVEYEIINKSVPYKQTLTHQKIAAVFWEINLRATLPFKNDEFRMVDRKNLVNFAFPKIIDCYLKDNSLNLKLL